jgi:hypothetical protein
VVVVLGVEVGGGGGGGGGWRRSGSISRYYMGNSFSINSNTSSKVAKGASSLKISGMDANMCQA